MEKSLIERLESAVARLESLSIGSKSGSNNTSRDLSMDDSNSSSDPSIVAFDELMQKSVARVLTAAEKIGGKVLEGTKILEEAFLAEKDLLINSKKCQVDQVLIQFA